MTLARSPWRRRFVSGLAMFLAVASMVRAEDREMAGTCALPVRAIAASVRLHCERAPVPDGAAAATSAAIGLLEATGEFVPRDFDGLTILWCPLVGARGLVPDADTILLDVGLLPHPARAAATLAHEMVHIRQFRRMPSGTFECAYLNHLVACRGCQNRNHPFEAEALAMEHRVRRHLGLR